MHGYVLRRDCETPLTGQRVDQQACQLYWCCICWTARGALHATVCAGGAVLDLIPCTARLCVTSDQVRLHTRGWAGHAMTVYITGTGRLLYASCMESIWGFEA